MIEDILKTNSDKKKKKNAVNWWLLKELDWLSYADSNGL